MAYACFPFYFMSLGLIIVVMPIFKEVIACFCSF